MQAYSPRTLKTRIVSAVIAVLASTILLGGELGLFEMVSNDAVLAARASSAAVAAAATAGAQPSASGG